jgi:hypothetical protein
MNATDSTLRPRLSDLLWRKTTCTSDGDGWRDLDDSSIRRHAGAMTARLLCLHCLARIASLMLVMPFVMLSLVAQGYMPVQGAGGGITMVICSVDGPVSMSIDPVTGEELGHKAPKDGRCSWAQMTSAVVIADMPMVSPPILLSRAVVPASPDNLWRPAFDPRGLFARGPPATV